MGEPGRRRGREALKTRNAKTAKPAKKPDLFCVLCGLCVQTFMKPEDYSRRQQELAGWAVTIETYKLGDVYHCTIANVDPGARFARADGATKEEAESHAIEKATRYLAQTRKFEV